MTNKEMLIEMREWLTKIVGDVDKYVQLQQSEGGGYRANIYFGNHAIQIQ